MSKFKTLSEKEIRELYDKSEQQFAKRKEKELAYRKAYDEAEKIGFKNIQRQYINAYIKALDTVFKKYGFKKYGKMFFRCVNGKKIEAFYFDVLLKGKGFITTMYPCFFTVWDYEFFEYKKLNDFTLKEFENWDAVLVDAQKAALERYEIKPDKVLCSVSAAGIGIGCYRLPASVWMDDCINPESFDRNIIPHHATQVVSDKTDSYLTETTGLVVNFEATEFAFIDDIVKHNGTVIEERFLKKLTATPNDEDFSNQMLSVVFGKDVMDAIYKTGGELSEEYIDRFLKSYKEKMLAEKAVNDKYLPLSVEYEKSLGGNICNGRRPEDFAEYQNILKAEFMKGVENPDDETLMLMERKLNAVVIGDKNAVFLDWKAKNVYEKYKTIFEKGYHKKLCDLFELSKTVFSQYVSKHKIPVCNIDENGEIVSTEK